MTSEQIHGPHGAVVVDVVDSLGVPKTVTLLLKPLENGEELLLGAEIRAMAIEERRKMIDEQIARLSAVKDPQWPHRQAVSQLVSMSIGEPSGEELDLARVKLSGVRAELWHRSKKTNPNLTRDEIAAVVTPANFNIVFGLMMDAIAVKKPGDKSPAAGEAA